MKPVSEWTDAELASEHDAAIYFANTAEDRETQNRAETRINEIERERDRRALVTGAAKSCTVASGAFAR